MDDIEHFSSVQQWRINRRELLALLGTGVAGTAVFGRSSRLDASAPPPPPVVSGPSAPPPTMTPVGAPTVADLAASLQWDTEQIFRYVTDEVGYDAYGGALRGATGTLWGLGGNSVDQALLLGALLEEAAVPWRFAIGSLDDAAATTVLGSLSPSRDVVRRRTAKAVLPQDVADRWLSGDPDTTSWTRAPEVDALLTQARSRAGATVDLLTKALADAGIDVSVPQLALPQLEIDRHVWVQYADGPTWIDLDPTRPDAQPGSTLALAADTPAELPDELYHTVTIRLVGDTVSGGAFTPSELASTMVRSADVVGVPIHVAHPGAEFIGVAEAITGVKQYAPTILVGDLITDGTTFALSAGPGIADVLSDASSAAEGQTVAERMEIEVAKPDGTSTVSTRTIFDRLTPEQRARGTVEADELPAIPLVYAGETLGNVFAPLASTITLVVNTQSIPRAYFGDSPDAEDTVVMARTAHAHAYLRDVAKLDALDDLGGRAYLDEPNVSAFWVGAGAATSELTPVVLSSEPASAVSVSELEPAPTSPEGSIPDPEAPKSVFAAVDVVHAHRLVVPFEGPATAATTLLASGLEHASERIVLEGTFGIAPGAPPATFASVGRIFEEAGRQGIGVRVVTPGASAPDDLDANAARFVTEALDAGRVVVLPERAVSLDGSDRIGWWEIDPQTGQAWDRLDDGRGTELGEFALLIHEMFQWALCFVSLGGAVYSVAVGATNDAIAWGAVAVGACIGAVAGGVPGAGGH